MMVEMYTRTRRFKDCVNAFISAGFVFPKEALPAVLIDDAGKIKELIASNPGIFTGTYSLFN